MIPLCKVFNSHDVEEKVGRVLKSGYVAQGPRVDEFEGELAKYFRRNEIVTTNSCTSALHLALHILKKKLGSDISVLSSPLTCAASSCAIAGNGLRIKWCDVDRATLNIDLDSVRAKLKYDTPVLLLVHWSGYPINYRRLQQIKDFYQAKYSRHLYVVEDCAHAWNSYFHADQVGTHPEHFSCFSCQAVKTLNTGDGGVLVCPKSFYSDARKLRWFGLDRDNHAGFRALQDIEHWGFKFHMNDIAATIGLANLPHVRYNIDRHRDNAAYYNKSLRGLDGVTLLRHNQRGEDSSYWVYTLLLEDREEFHRYMVERGIQVSPLHVRNDKLSCFKKYEVKLPALNSVEDRYICIPCGWWVDNKQREHIVKSIRKFYG